jgi:D-amino-acid dehydrogenase
VIGAVPGTPGLYVGTGHAMMGMTLGPVTARVLADMVLGAPPPLALPLADPARYSLGAAGPRGAAGVPEPAAGAPA